MKLLYIEVHFRRKDGKCEVKKNKFKENDYSVSYTDVDIYMVKWRKQWPKYNIGFPLLLLGSKNP